MSIFDPFHSEALTRVAPPRNAREITPSDTDDLPVRPTYIWVEAPTPNATVSLAVQMGDEAVTLRFAGDNGLSIAPTQIFATGTTASRIILFW